VELIYCRSLRDQDSAAYPVLADDVFSSFEQHNKGLARELEKGFYMSFNKLICRNSVARLLFAIVIKNNLLSYYSLFLL
jgi:hypothetical protein